VASLTNGRRLNCAPAMIDCPSCPSRLLQGSLDCDGARSDRRLSDQIVPEHEPVVRPPRADDAPWSSPGWKPLLRQFDTPSRKVPASSMNSRISLAASLEVDPILRTVRRPS